MCSPFLTNSLYGVTILYRPKPCSTFLQRQCAQSKGSIRLHKCPHAMQIQALEHVLAEAKHKITALKQTNNEHKQQIASLQVMVAESDNTCNPSFVERG